MSEQQQLVAKLKSGTIAEKRQTLDALRNSNSGVLSYLVANILSADNEHLSWTLDGYDYERGEGQKNNFVLVEDTIEYDYWYVFAITYLLVELGEQSVNAVLPLLTHEKPIIRAWSAFVLGDIGNENAIPHLLKRLKTTDQTELWRVCEALGKLKAVDAVERLIELLEDEEAGVDGAAATALGEIGDLRALMPLIEQLKKHKPSVYSISAALYHYGEHAVLPLTEVLFDEKAQNVHDLALMKLGQLKDPRAIEPVLRYLDSNSDRVGKHAAISTLGQLKSEQAVSRIAKYFQTTTDRDIRYISAMALAEIGNQKAFETLVYELEHGSPERQHEAALAFGEIETLEEISPLLNALKNGSPSIRSAIAVSLGNLQDSRAVPALQEALNDSDQSTRQYVQMALGKIKGLDPI